MPSAIEIIVDAYVRLGNKHSLETLRDERLKLAAMCRDRTDFDFSLLLGQIAEEAIEIERGLNELQVSSTADVPE